MKNYISLTIILLFLFSWPIGIAYGHGGGLDQYGGHYNWADGSGSYHYHQGGGGCSSNNPVYPRPRETNPPEYIPIPESRNGTYLIDVSVTIGNSNTFENQQTIVIDNNRVYTNGSELPNMNSYHDNYGPKERWEFNGYFRVLYAIESPWSACEEDRSWYLLIGTQETLSSYNTVKGRVWTCDWSPPPKTVNILGNMTKVD